jgi:hypothetical protein
MTSLQFRDYLQTQTSADVTGFFDGWVFNGGFPDYKIISTNLVGSLPDLEMAIIISQATNHAPSQFSGIPLEIGFYDGNFKLTTHSVTVGPNQTTVNIQVDPSNIPAIITLNPNNKLNYATTDDVHIIKSSGTFNFPNGMMNVKVTSLSDSALLKISHHWSAPSPSGSWIDKPYRLSNYRYWTVEGILPTTFDATVDIVYDGKASGGYLDSMLVNITEDSLVLLYRKNLTEEWYEYPYYTKNTLGSSSNKFGLMQLTKLLLGEYSLANLDHSVLGTGSIEQQKNELNIYPNPSSDMVTIEWNDSHTPKSIEIYSLDGKRILSFTEMNQNSFSFNGKTLKNGQYVAQVKFNNAVTSKQFTVLR